MIRDYSPYVSQRWIEMRIAERSAGMPVDSPEIKAIQCGALVTIASELRHTTAFEWRQHPDVGLLFKDWGNFFDVGNGLKVATDILAIRDTDGSAGNVIDPTTFAIVDCIVSVASKDARIAWQVTGMASGSDTTRFREPPTPAVDPGHVDPPVDPVDPDPPQVVDERVNELLEALKAGQIADAEIQARILATLEGLRRDVNNAGKLLAQLIAGGGIADILNPKKARIDSNRSAKTRHAIIQTDKLRKLPEGFDRDR